MTKNRYINTKFWDDSYVLNLDPTEKLLFNYAITNPLTNIAGIYEIDLRHISLHTGIDKEMVLKILGRFEDDGKIKYRDGWIAIRNFIKHQKVNPNVEKGISLILDQSPKDLVDWIGLESLPKPLKYCNSNTNRNRNSNTDDQRDASVDAVFSSWNDMEIVQHKKIQPVMLRDIQKALKKYGYDYIFQSILNYRAVLKSDLTYWTKKWTLSEFLSRGLERFGEYSSSDDAIQNYLSGKPEAKDQKKGPEWKL